MEWTEVVNLLFRIKWSVCVVSIRFLNPNAEWNESWEWRSWKPKVNSAHLAGFTCACNLSKLISCDKKGNFASQNGPQMAIELIQQTGQIGQVKPYLALRNRKATQQIQSHWNRGFFSDWQCIIFLIIPEGSTKTVPHPLFRKKMMEKWHVVGCKSPLSVSFVTKI